MTHGAALAVFAPPASRLTRALAVLTLAALPFSAVNVGIPAGDMGGNLSLPFVAALGVLLLPANLPFPFRTLGDDPYERLVVAIFRFFLWCALVTLATGIAFESAGLDAFGLTPFAHSIARFPIPVVLGLVVAVGFLIGSRVMEAEASDRVLVAVSVGVVAYGFVQLYAMMAAPDWYPPLAEAVEGQRFDKAGGEIFVDYLAENSRLNLTTFEAAEAARLLLIVFLPVLVTQQGRASPDAFRLFLIGAMMAFIALAETIVGLAGLVLFVLMMLPLLPPRLRSMTLAMAPIAAVLLLLVLPDDFIDRILALFSTSEIAGFDQSVLTRAAFVVASIDVLFAHPLTGIGWSKDIFFLTDAMPEWGMTWEVTRSLTTGEAVAAKSLAVRILLYGGIPAFLLLAWAYGRALRAAYSANRAHPDPLLMRGVMVMVMFAFCGLVDGGLLTAFYSFVALGLTLGQLSARAADRT